MSAAHGLWWRLESARVQNAARRRWSHAHRNCACLALPDSTATGGLAGVGGERSVGGVALAAVADLGDHRRGAQPRVWGDEQRAECRPIGMRVERVADLDTQL